MKEIHKISDLDQVRLLSDPLKLKLIQAFAEGPRTTREVAQNLGENVTRLYRHVDALHDAGLIEITHEEQKRGTVERTFQAVARRFEVERGLFDDHDKASETVRDLLRTVEDDLLAAFAMPDAEPIFMGVRLKASPAAMADLRGKLEEWLETANTIEADGTDEDAEYAGALIAFYPLRD